MAMLLWVVVVVVVLIDKRTWVLCWTLLATIGLMASSRSSFSADAAMADDEGYQGRLLGLTLCWESYFVRTLTDEEGRVFGRAVDSAE